MTQRGVAAALLLLLGACGDPFDQGRQAFEEGAWEEAIERLQQVRRLSEDYDRAQAMIARACLHLGREAYERQDWDTALLWLAKLGRSDPDYQEARNLTSSVHFARAMAAHEAGDRTEAMAQLELIKSDWDRYEEAERSLAESQAKEAIDREAGLTEDDIQIETIIRKSASGEVEDTTTLGGGSKPAPPENADEEKE